MYLHDFMDLTTTCTVMLQGWNGSPTGGGGGGERLISDLPTL